MTSSKQQKSDRQVILAHLLSLPIDEQDDVWRLVDQFKGHLYRIGDETALELAYKLCRFINNRPLVDNSVQGAQNGTKGKVE